ncbi:hypothetical protein ACFL2U_03085 [Patescibacteria group bacterium]
MTNKKKGKILIIAPISAFAAILVLFFINNFVVSMVSTDPTALSTDKAAAIGSIISVILSLLGVVSVLAFIIGLPIGIYFLVKKENVAKTEGLK